MPASWRAPSKPAALSNCRLVSFGPFSMGESIPYLAYTMRYENSEFLWNNH
jgi:hypothetical protein